MKPFALLVVLLVLLTPLWAQDGQRLPAKATPAPQTTLGTELAHLDWEPMRRGALLLVAPDLRVWEGKNLLPPPPRNGYGLPELVGYFEQQMVRFSTLTTAGPIRITELRVPPVVEDLQQDFNRERKPHTFLASLSPSQLQQAGGAQGIGYEDLSDAAQKALWDKMFPPTLDFLGSSAVPLGMISGQTPWDEKRRLPLLSVATQRRFRLCLRYKVTLLAQPGNIDIALSPPLPGSVTVALRALPVPPDQLGEYQSRRAKEGALTQEIPYHRKPSDLDLSSERFAVPISLDGAKTIGDVVQRSAQALRLELYADARLAPLPVYTRVVPGQTVRASDALNALLRATATTIRRLQVGSSVAYVMSYDRVPLGNLSVTLFDGTMPQELSKQREELSELKALTVAKSKLGQAKLLTSLPRGVGGGVSEKIWQAALEHKDTKFPLTELSGDTRAKVQAAWSARQGKPGSDGIPLPPAPQSVRARVGVVVQILCPSLGEANLEFIPPQDLMPPPDMPLVKLPVAIKMRGLRVRSPQTATEAKQLLNEAKRRGFTTLYVTLSGDASDDRGLGLLSAEKGPLSLVPTLSPLMPAPTDVSRERDISVTGRTASEMAQGRAALSDAARIFPFVIPIFEQITRLDALTPEAVPVDRFAARVARLAALPGVSQIAFTDLAAPGYLEESDSQVETLWAGGYSTAERLAFLRAKGIDPADFLFVDASLGASSEEISLPFFTDEEQSDPLKHAWKERCKERVELLRKRLEAAFRAARVSKPLQVLKAGFMSMGESSWNTWKGGLGPRNIPHWELLVAAEFGRNADSSTDPAAMIRQSLAQLLESRAASDGEQEPRESRGVSSPGFVYDLSELPLGEALKVLEVVIAPKN